MVYEAILRVKMMLVYFQASFFGSKDEVISADDLADLEKTSGLCVWSGKRIPLLHHLAAAAGGTEGAPF